MLRHWLQDPVFLSTIYYIYHVETNKKLIRRGDSERKLSLRTTKYNNLVHKCRHRSTRLYVGMHIYQIQWNNAMQRPLCRSKSFKVTDFGANRKLIYDFLLVINTNLPPILHRFQVIISQSYCFHYNTCITRINTMIVKHRNRCQNDLLA